MKIKITLTLDHETDADIIGFLDSFSPIARNAHIRQAVRDHIAIERNKTTMKDLFVRIEHLINLLTLYGTQPSYPVAIPSSGTPTPDNLVTINVTGGDAVEPPILYEPDMLEILKNINDIGE